MGKTPRSNNNSSTFQPPSKTYNSKKPLFPGEEKDHDPSRRMVQLRKILMTIGSSFQKRLTDCGSFISAMCI